MSFDIQDSPNAVAYALAVAQNQLRLDNIGANAHLDRTSKNSGVDYKAPVLTRVAITYAAATNDATAILLANNIKSVVNVHFPDVKAHNAAVSAVVATADATDLTTCIALDNSLKSTYEAHRTASTVHYTNDSTNTISSANATDSATNITLVNELRTDVAAHMAMAPAGTNINIVPF